MVQDVIKSVGAGGDFATLAAFSAALPGDLVAANERWIAELWNGTADPGGAVIDTVCDATRYVVIRAAAGQGPGDVMDPYVDALRAQAGKGAMVAAAAGDAIAVAGASTRLAISNLQIVAQAGSAVRGDGSAEIFSIENSILEANSAFPAVATHGVGSIAHCAVIQRGEGDGIALRNGALADACTVVKPARSVALGVGITFDGSPAAGARSCFVTGFGRAYGTGAATAEALASDQVNILAVPDDFADPYWSAVGSAVNPADTVPGPYGVPLQWLGSNLNAFARFEGPVIASLMPGERIAFSVVVAQPTALVSAIVLDSAAGRPELRVTWSDNPPNVGLLAQLASFAARAGSVTDLGGGQWRLELEAENTTAAPIDVTPIVYVTRDVANSGLNVGFYAGAMMAGLGHLGTGFVETGAVPGIGSFEGIDPTEAVFSVTEGAEDLRPVAGGPLAGAGVSGTGTDLYLRYRNVPDTVGAVTLAPGIVASPEPFSMASILDQVRLIDQADVLSATRRRTVLPAAPPRRIGV